jgi:2-methylcitrate dehydratase PrpD
MRGLDHSLEKALIDWAVDLRFEHIPEQAVSQSKRLVVDTLAAAWAGAGAVGVDAVRRFVVEQGGKPVSRLWGGDDRVPAPSAAWFNGVPSAALDFDSVHDEATCIQML